MTTFRHNQQICMEQQASDRRPEMLANPDESRQSQTTKQSHSDKVKRKHTHPNKNTCLSDIWKDILPKRQTRLRHRPPKNKYQTKFKVSETKFKQSQTSVTFRNWSCCLAPADGAVGRTGRAACGCHTQMVWEPRRARRCDKEIAQGCASRTPARHVCRRNERSV